MRVQHRAWPRTQHNAHKLQKCCTHAQQQQPLCLLCFGRSASTSVITQPLGQAGALQVSSTSLQERDPFMINFLDNMICSTVPGRCRARTRSRPACPQIVGTSEQHFPWINNFLLHFTCCISELWFAHPCQRAAAPGPDAAQRVHGVHERVVGVAAAELSVAVRHQARRHEREGRVADDRHAVHEQQRRARPLQA